MHQSKPVISQEGAVVVEHTRPRKPGDLPRIQRNFKHVLRDHKPKERHLIFGEKIGNGRAHHHFKVSGLAIMGDPNSFAMKLATEFAELIGPMPPGTKFFVRLESASQLGEACVSYN